MTKWQREMAEFFFRRTYSPVDMLVVLGALALVVNDYGPMAPFVLIVGVIVSRVGANGLGNP